MFNNDKNKEIGKQWQRFPDKTQILEDIVSGTEKTYAELLWKLYSQKGTEKAKQAHS